MPTAMVTFNGRVTLPPHLRRELGLKTGDSVDFIEIEKGRFAIQPNTGSVAGSGSTANHRRWISRSESSPASADLDSVESDNSSL